MIHFTTDYHLGSTLNTHTTHASRAALREAIFSQAMKLTEDQENPHFIAGDLVNTYKNDEHVIQQALTILSRVTNCIMGNHDVTNRTDSMGTMELLEPIVDVVGAKMGKCEPELHLAEGTAISLVPHTNTQDLFEETLTKMAKRSLDKPEILVLHCNYELPWDANETTLNLTEDMAKKLLERFDYILIGHEHNHRTALGGRVVLLGNIHPTNFGDISDKYRWTYQDGKLEKHLIWEKSKHYVEIKPFTEEKLGPDTQFVKIVGSVDASEYPAYCRSLAKLWKNNEGCFAIRSAVEIRSSQTEEAIDTESLKSLTETIKEELADTPEMKKLFDELLEEI